MAVWRADSATAPDTRSWRPVRAHRVTYRAGLEDTSRDGKETRTLYRTGVVADRPNEEPTCTTDARSPAALSPFSLSPLDLDPWCEASPFVIASNLP
jgi:hypothetical protein